MVEGGKGKFFLLLLHKHLDSLWIYSDLCQLYSRGKLKERKGTCWKALQRIPSSTSHFCCLYPLCPQHASFPPPICSEMSPSCPWNPLTSPSPPFLSWGLWVICCQMPGASNNFCNWFPDSVQQHTFCELAAAITTAEGNVCCYSGSIGLGHKYVYKEWARSLSSWLPPWGPSIFWRASWP